MPLFFSRLRIGQSNAGRSAERFDFQFANAALEVDKPDSVRFHLPRFAILGSAKNRFFLVNRGLPGERAAPFLPTTLLFAREEDIVTTNDPNADLPRSALNA